jgi:hypothetical protein
LVNSNNTGEASSKIYGFFFVIIRSIYFLFGFEALDEEEEDDDDDDDDEDEDDDVDDDDVIKSGGNLLFTESFIVARSRMARMTFQNELIKPSSLIQMI